MPSSSPSSYSYSLTYNTQDILGRNPKSRDHLGKEGGKDKTVGGVKILSCVRLTSTQSRHSTKAKPWLEMPGLDHRPRQCMASQPQGPCWTVSDWLGRLRALGGTTGGPGWLEGRAGPSRIVLSSTSNNLDPRARPSVPTSDTASAHGPKIPAQTG